MQCLSALCVLGIILVGVLLTTNAITLEQAGSALVRGFVVLVLALWVICILKGLAAAALPTLKTLLVWTLSIGLILAGILLVAAVILRIAKRLPNQVNRERGEQ